MAKIDRDPIARILATGAIVIGGALTADRIIERQQPERQNATVQIIEQQMVLNFIGDWMNENIMRATLGYPLITTREFMQERKDWIEEFSQPTLPKELPDKGKGDS